MLLNLLVALPSAAAAAVLLWFYYSSRRKGMDCRKTVFLLAVLAVFGICILLWGILRNFFPTF